MWGWQCVNFANPSIAETVRSNIITLLLYESFSKHLIFIFPSINCSHYTSSLSNKSLDTRNLTHIPEQTPIALIHIEISALKLHPGTVSLLPHNNHKLNKIYPSCVFPYKSNVHCLIIIWHSFWFPTKSPFQVMLFDRKPTIEKHPKCLFWSCQVVISEYRRTVAQSDLCVMNAMPLYQSTEYLDERLWQSYSDDMYSFLSCLHHVTWRYTPSQFSGVQPSHDHHIRVHQQQRNDRKSIKHLDCVRNSSNHGLFLQRRNITEDVHWT